ncbi:MAG: asparagine synthase C-terminal domain-containing protein [Aigarchaeota archaeon]|nr:asparagine synthase C-terminal domain-containing protein [Aigarchaeota archaeon]MDW8093111.1 asparagine synthase C-terminal domain-containing protein [Nitrososphaerota archaeon]
MAILFLAGSERPEVLSRYANEVQRYAHKLPTVEIYLDGHPVSPGSFAESEGEVALVLLHSKGTGIVRSNKDGLHLELSMNELFEVPGNASPFYLRLKVGGDGNFMVNTDHVSSFPLSHAHGDVRAFASWDSLLRTVNGAAESLEPLSTVSCEQSSCASFNNFEGVVFSRRGEGDVAEVLSEMIYDAVKRSAPRRSLAVMSSGGVDSAILLKVSADLGLAPLAITVGLKGSNDFQAARYVATAVGADSVEVIMEKDDAVRSAKYVISSLSLKSAMDVSIATIFYSVAEVARSHNRRVLVAGQGADELFGGYHKYLRLNESEISDVLRSDALNLWRDAVRRDYAASAIGGCALLLPYLDRTLFHFAMNLPPHLKLSGGERKVILRRVAEKVGLPREVAERPKKAAQYSSRLEGVLKPIVHNIY